MNTEYNINSLAEIVTIQKLETMFREFRLQDKKEGKEVAIRNGADINKVRVYKDIIGKECALYQAMKNALSAVRNNFYVHTMRYSGDGYRLLPNAVFMDFIKSHDSLTQQFNHYADKFCEPSNIVELQHAARLALGNLYDDRLFITGNLRKCYGIKLIPSMIPAGIKSNLQGEAFQYVLTGMLQSQREFLLEGFKDSFHGENGFITKLDHLITQLHGVDSGSTKKIYDSLVYNVLNVATTIKRLNIFNDPEINDIASKAENLLSGINADKLRNSKSLRENIIAESKNIVSSASNKLSDLEGLLS